MNPYDPPSTILDVQHPRILVWLLRLQLAGVVITALASLQDSGTYGRIELQWPLIEMFPSIALIGLPLAVLGGLLWLVELMRLWIQSRGVYWYLLLHPLLTAAWLFCFLPLVQ